MRSLEEVEQERLETIEQKAALDGEIATITKQLDNAELRQRMTQVPPDLNWWHKATDARLHKQRLSQELQTRLTALNNERKVLSRQRHHSGGLKNRQAEIAVLYRVAHAAESLLREGKLNPCTEIGLALADLDETVPGWDTGASS